MNNKIWIRYAIALAKTISVVLAILLIFRREASYMLAVSAFCSSLSITFYPVIYRDKELSWCAKGVFIFVIFLLAIFTAHTFGITEKISKIVTTHILILAVSFTRATPHSYIKSDF
ncbi:MAG TPA: hypothetical protein GX733_08470 [Tissierellia bacterium]|nr:hypothetical protein [Tissierellia bacterium]